MDDAQLAPRPVCMALYTTSSTHDVDCPHHFPSLCWLHRRRHRDLAWWRSNLTEAGGPNPSAAPAAGSGDAVVCPALIQNTTEKINGRSGAKKINGRPGCSRRAVPTPWSRLPQTSPARPKPSALRRPTLPRMPYPLPTCTLPPHPPRAQRTFPSTATTS